MNDSSTTDDLKRRRTRTALLDAVRCLATDQVRHPATGKIAIHDITDAAGFGVGTFYNYFDTKQDIFVAVLDQIREEFNDRLEQLRKDQQDLAMLLASSLKLSFTEARDNRDWPLFLPHSGLPGNMKIRLQRQQLLADLCRGRESGRFRIDNPDFVCELIEGMTDHIHRAINDGKLTDQAIADTVRYILRMLGLPDVVAGAVADTPLPDRLLPGPART